MAANLKDPEERERRIKMVGEYFEETGDTTRNIAKYFTDNYFEISNKTVHGYINKYMEMYPAKSANFKDLIDNNTEKTIDDKEVKVRIFSACKLILEDYTIKETADILGTTYKVIEHDIEQRLKKLAEKDENINKIYQLVLSKLNQHQIDALNKNRNSSIN